MCLCLCVNICMYPDVGLLLFLCEYLWPYFYFHVSAEPGQGN